MAVYDGSSSVEDLKAKFCSTVANDVMLRTGLGVIRLWADEGSRNSRFQMLFTSFQERKILNQNSIVMYYLMMFSFKPSKYDDTVCDNQVGYFLLSLYRCPIYI